MSGHLGPTAGPQSAGRPSLDTFIQSHEAGIRLGAFFGIFALMALLELRAPRRALTASKTLRWGSNLGLVVLNTILPRLLFPAAAAAVGWGLLNHYQVHLWIAAPLAVIAMDLATGCSTSWPMPCRPCGACIGSITQTWTTA